MKKFILSALIAIPMVFAANISSAHDRDDDGDWREHGWRHRHHWNQSYYAPAPVYYAPRPVYYNAYYRPAPVIVERPAYYNPPLFSFGLALGH